MVHMVCMHRVCKVASFLIDSSGRSITIGVGFGLVAGAGGSLGRAFGGAGWSREEFEVSVEARLGELGRSWGAGWGDFGGRLSVD